jgi:formiminoglutamase
MLPVGPTIAPDTGAVRPAICLGDVRGTSCPRETTEKLADCLRQAFDLPASEVTINRPFAGGYITRTYGSQPLPWIQVELNRALYLDDGGRALTASQEQLALVKGIFSAALEAFCEEI